MVKAYFFIAIAMVLNACSSVPSHQDEKLPHSVKSLYDEGISSDRPTFVTIRGRLNLFIAAEPGTLLILRDLRDPLGYSANFVDEDTAERIFEQFNEVEKGAPRFPYLHLSPLKAFYGQFPAKPLFEAESKVVKTLREYENKCVEVSGVVVPNRLHSDLEDLDFATIVPFEFTKCSNEVDR